MTLILNFRENHCQYFVTDKILAVVKLLIISRVALCSRV